MGSQTQRLARGLFRNAGNLEQDAAGLHNGNPVLGRTLTGTHSGLSGLLSHGLIGEDLDPNLTATVAELKKELFNLRFQLATGQLQNTMQITAVKRDIARALTVLRQKEQA